MRKIIKALILILLLSLRISYSKSLQELLSKINKEKDPSKKTYIQSLGHYTVFTREDIERMGATTLGDLLRSIRFFTLMIGPYGSYELVPAGTSSSIYDIFNIYINNTEVSSGYTNDIGSFYINYPLVDVDHVEIYFGPGSVSLGQKEGLLIIRIFTKNPKRENTNLIKISSSIRGGYNISLLSAKPINKYFSYSFALNKSYNTFKKYNNVNVNTLSNYAFLNINYKAFHIDTSFYDERFHPIMADNIYNQTYGGLNISKGFYITLSSNLKNSTSFSLSFNTETRKVSEYSPFGLFIPYAYSNNLYPVYLYDDRTINKYSFNISKKFVITKKDNLLAGFSSILTTNNISNINYKAYNLLGILNPYTLKQPFTKQLYYSLYFENSYNINPSNLLIFDLKLDRYKRNGNLGNDNDYTVRVGYISKLNKDIYFKSFIYKTYIAPSFYDIEGTLNNKLRDIRDSGASSEIDFKLGKNKLSLMGAYANIRNYILTSFYPIMTNYNYMGDLSMAFFDINDTYEINSLNSISFDYYIVKENFNAYSPRQGGFIKIFTRYKRLNLYNELIYRKAYLFNGTHIDSTYTLDSYIKYNIKPNFNASISIVNALNSSPSTPVITSGGIMLVPSFSPTVIFSVERLF